MCHVEQQDFKTDLLTLRTVPRSPKRVHDVQELDRVYDIKNNVERSL